MGTALTKIGNSLKTNVPDNRFGSSIFFSPKCWFSTSTTSMTCCLWVQQKWWLLQVLIYLIDKIFLYYIISIHAHLYRYDKHTYKHSLSWNSSHFANYDHGAAPQATLWVCEHAVNFWGLFQRWGWLKHYETALDNQRARIAKSTQIGGKRRQQETSGHTKRTQK